MPLILNHPSFRIPAPENKLWRYMEFAKFVAMITSQGFWFCNMEVLARADPFEGSIPKGNLIHKRWKSKADMNPSEIAEIEKIVPENGSFEQTLKRVIASNEGMTRSVSAMRETFFINCWHNSLTESAAMWKAYGLHDCGIAITTSVDRLAAGFSKLPDDIYCGMIDYIDFEKGSIDLANVFNTVLKKRQSFSSENEARLVWWDAKLLDFALKKGNGEKTEVPPPGRLINCSLNEAIDEIWISPTAPDWLFETMQAICRPLGFERRIRRSNLLDAPFDKV